MTAEHADVLVVGGGPSGLASSIELRRLGVGRVVVLDRERVMGGIPRHSDHLGYGMVDLKRVFTGPRYARWYARHAAAAGAELRPETSVVGWSGDRTVRITSPSGRGEIEADAVVLATGCRERPRSARLVPGTRPAGIFTTGSLQQFVHLHDRRVGRRAVVVGAEHVAFSALLTLEHAGAKTLAVLTEQPRHQSYRPLVLVTATRLRVPVLGGQKVIGILGRKRVEAVEVTDMATGASRQIACDTIVFTGDWIPDHELARLAELEMDPGTKGPSVDAALRTSAKGVFAIGNLLHGAETSDVVALEGRHVAGPIRAWLGGDNWRDSPVPVLGDEAISWIAPNAIQPGEATLPPSGHFTMRVGRFIEGALLEAHQGSTVLWAGRPTSGMLASFAPFLPATFLHGALVPGRPVHIPASWISRVRADAGPVTLRIKL
ncbi:MAG: NAD(P)/FAD-dependent oxidoreductase [Candidatus Limnocylindrales bacterium]